MITMSSGHMDRVGVIRETDEDRDSASNVALAGESLSGSLCGSTCTAPGPSGYHNRYVVRGSRRVSG